MNDLKLRDALRPLANAINPRSNIDAIRTVKEAFRHDRKIEPSAVADVIPLQRLDWHIAASSPTGAHQTRYYMPESGRMSRIALVSSSPTSAAFSAQMLIAGVVVGAGSIMIGGSVGYGTISADIPAGSIMSIEVNSTIPQAITVSAFYRDEGI